MKVTMSLLGCVFLLFTQVLFLDEKVSADENDYKNFYGIAWCGKPAEDSKYAKHMGYKYVAINPSSTVKDYHKNPDCAGLKFYLVDPYWHSHVLSGYKRNVDTTKPVSDAAKDFYNQRMVWKGNDPFPDNLATGYHPTGIPTKFSVMWDFQQKAVIDEVVEKIINLAKRYEDSSLPFTFGGYIIDEPGLGGEFCRLDENGDNISVCLSYWTGADSGLVHCAITHEYAKYSEGRAAFYKQLFKRTREEWPDMKVVMEPYDIYGGWIEEIKDRVDKDELMPDALFQEGSNTDFVDNKQIFDSGLIIKDNVGITQTNEQGEYENRLYAAKAAISGAWYNWLGGTGDKSYFKSITKVYPRLKLIRCVPNWDNLNNVPLTDRSWDGSVYQSTKSYASSDVMYSRHPKTGKLFAVFLTLSGAITLNAGEAVASVQRTNGYFMESGDGSADVNIVGNEIRLKNKDHIGKGYIFTVSSDSNPSTVKTGPEINDTSSLETVNANSGTSTPQSASGLGYIEVSAKTISSKPGNVKAIGTKAVTNPQAVSTQTQWQQVPLRTQAQKTAGLAGGEGMQIIFDIASAPSNSKVYYFVTDTSQVWKSIDGGYNWTKKSKGFVINGAVSVVVDPTNENKVLVAGSMHSLAVPPKTSPYDGIYRTTDGGNTWKLERVTHYLRPSASMRGGVHFAFDPNNSNIVYAGTDDQGVLKSTNGGDTWTSLNLLTSVKIRDIKAHPTNSTIIYAAAPNGLWKITNPGGTPTSTKIGTNLPNYPKNLAINPSNPNIMYVAVERKTGDAGGVFKSTDGGTTFTRKNNGLQGLLDMDQDNEITRIAISKVNPNRLYASFANTGSRHPFYTSDGGENWSQPSDMDVGNYLEDINSDSSIGGNYFACPVAPSPSDALVAVGLGARSNPSVTTDGGNTWTPGSGFTGGATASGSSIGFDKNNSNIFAMALLDTGVFLTEDGGSTFKSLNVPAYNGHYGASGVAIRPGDPNTIITRVGNWADSQYMPIITRNKGTSWTQIPQDSSGNSMVGSARFVTYHPSNSNIIYLGRYKSTDNGYTWKILSHPVYAVHPTNGDTIYGAEESGSTLTFYKSTNGGTTWTQHSTVTAETVDGLAIAPGSPEKLYLASRTTGLFVWNGSQWVLQTEANGYDNDQFGLKDTRSVAVDPNNPLVIYAGKAVYGYGHSNGVFRSTDGGNTWTNITGNLGPEFNVISLHVNPDTSEVYVNSWHGTWKLPSPDAVAPNCSISINSGAPYTKSTAVTLTLSATDNVGVTGYYLSASATTSLASATEWTSVTTTTSYTGNVSYTLSSGDGIKTVYVRYKDAAGNVSTAASDSITLDTAVNTANNLQALYILNEGTGTIATDASGNGNNGTINGATWATGKSGGGLSFDGNDYVIKTNPSAGLKPSLEVATAAWIKTSATDTGGAEIVSMGDSYALRVETNGNIRLFYYNGSSWNSIKTTGVNVLDGAWHHIVGQKTSTALQIYVDGISKASTPNTGTIAYTRGTDLFIGRHGDGVDNYNFNGIIDDIRIYNRALSNQEVLDLYNNASTVITNGLQSHYALNEGTGTIATDASGNGNNGTINGATWATGKSGGGLSFDGNDYVIKTNPSAGLKPSLEVATAAWIKTSATDTGGAEIVSMGDSYALRVETNGNIRLFYYNGSSWNSIKTTGVNVLDGAWHYIVGQKTSTALQIYVDGISKASTPNTGTIAYTRGTDLFIGRHGDGVDNYNFNGIIDGIRIYNRALSNQEVQNLYTNGTN